LRRWTCCSGVLVFELRQEDQTRMKTKRVEIADAPVTVSFSNSVSRLQMVAARSQVCSLTTSGALAQVKGLVMRSLKTESDHASNVK
jgi:hypothetical protein